MAKKPGPSDSQVADALDAGNGNHSEQLPSVNLLRARDVNARFNLQTASVLIGLLVIFTAIITGYNTHGSKINILERQVSGADGEGGMKKKIETTDDKVNLIHTEQIVQGIKQKAIKEDVAETKEAVEKIRQLLEARLPTGD